MDEKAQGRARHKFEPPVLQDYGTLGEMTADTLLMHVGLGMGAAQSVTAPAAPGGVGGDFPGGSGGDTGGALGAEAAAPGDGGGGAGAGGGEAGELAAAGGESGGMAGVAGATATGGEVAGGSGELPVTGLDAAATAAAGAASLAAGVALRRVTEDEPA